MAGVLIGVQLEKLKFLSVLPDTTAIEVCAVVITVKVSLKKQ